MTVSVRFLIPVTQTSMQIIDKFCKLSINPVNAARLFRQRGTENFCIFCVVSYVTVVSVELDASFFSY